MDKASKLFQSAEIEYITPFLKLWMSFNSWYKKQYTRDVEIKTDRQHIEKIKTSKENTFKKEFEYLLTANNQEWFSQLENLLKELHTSDLKKNDKNDKNEFIYKHPDEHYYILLEDVCLPLKILSKKELDTMVESSYNRQGNLLVIRKEEEVFKFIIELLYQVRCALVHGDLDIDKQTHLNIIKSAYHVLFEVLQKVFGD